MNAISLTEGCDNWGDALVVDEERRIVKNVALAGLQSRNGYTYTTEALQHAVPLYADKPVFLDHAPDRLRPQERSTRDLVGTIINPRFEQDKIRGDICVLETESGATFLALVKSERPGIGMSHVVLAHRSLDGKTVEQIQDVISVDTVIRPATTSTFRESISTSSTEETAETLTLQAVRAERDQLRQELEQLRHAYAESTVEHEIRNLLHESELPQSAITDHFLQQLRVMSTTADRRALVQDRCRLLTLSESQQVPRSLSRQTPGATTDHLFISAIRRR